MLDSLRRAIERALPWYDVEEEARRDAHTEAIRRRSIAARIRLERLSDEQLVDAYRAAARKLAR